VTAPATIAAQLNAPIGTLPYQIITTSRTASTSVAANGTTHATRAASGVATIYNNYSTQSQDLIANTRFEAPDGKIYRIHSVLTVPGASKNADGSLNPGSISTSLFADQPGAEYNRGSTQFTIPGFKGDPRYTKFYAQAGSITNGFVGTEPAVASSTLASAKSAMEQGLQNALRSAAATGIPVEFLPVPGTLQITYGTVEATAGQNGQVILSQSAQASADIVRAADLAAAIARQEVQGYNGEAVGFADNTQIAIALASSSKTTEGALQLQLSGTPTLVWQFDPNSLKQALLGKNKSQFESIIQSFAPAIECSPKTPCNASLRPFWKQNFPSDPAKITVVSPLPKQ
jgi:hypothetical protein